MSRQGLVFLACLLVAVVCVGLASTAVAAESTTAPVSPVTMVKEVFAATCPKACGATCTIMFHRCNIACNRRCGMGSDWRCGSLCTSDCGVQNNNCVRGCQAGLQLAAATLSELVEEAAAEKKEQSEEKKTSLGALAATVERAAERSLAASNFAAVHAAVTSQVDSPSVEPCKDPNWTTQCKNRIPACKNACRCGGGGVDAAMRCNKCQVQCDKEYDSCIYCGMGVEFCCSGAVICDDGWNTVAAKLA